MSGKISLKPYFRMRDKRLDELQYALTINTSKYFPTVLIDIILDLVISAEDYEILEDLHDKIVDGMNNRVKHLWKDMVNLDIDRSWLKVEPAIQVYKLDRHIAFIEQLVTGHDLRVDNKNKAYRPKKLDLNIAQFICQELYKIKTRNKYYYQDNKLAIHTKDNYRKKYRAMCERDMDTVGKLARIVDDIRGVQDEWEHDEEFKNRFESKKYVMPQYSEWWDWRKKIVYFMHNALMGTYDRYEDKMKRYNRAGYEVVLDQGTINYIKRSKGETTTYDLLDEWEPEYNRTYDVIENWEHES